ncbi:MAG TPA: hypothetical protein VFN42_10745 [Acetobacteraceae bacterium]|nr:hypothetical protein [Acetobacteraceae bacterium]
MIIPSGIIMPLFFVGFAMTCYQYYHIDPRRRVLNLRFAIMAVTTVGAVSFPVVQYLYGQKALLAPVSQGYTAAGVLCLVLSYILLKRMPPAEHY